MFSPETIIPQVVLGEAQSPGLPLTVKPWDGVITDRRPVITLELKSEGSIPWRHEDFLVMDITTAMTSTVTIFTEFYTGDEMRFFIRNTLLGDRRVKSCCELKYLDSSRNYPRNLPGHFKCHVRGKPTDLKEVDRVLIHITAARDFTQMTVHDIYLTSTEPTLAIEGEPVVDALGQNLQRDFKEKFACEADMIAYLQAQYAWAKAQEGYPQPDYDRFGGWKKLNFGADGKFRRHHDGKRWWLVDPEGNAFFSNGICYGHRTGIYGMVTSYEALFSWLPERNDPKFTGAYTTGDKIPEYVKRNGPELAKTKVLFNFARANMIRAFGDGWKEAYATISAARLKAWGFNTLSVCVNDYEDEDTLQLLKWMQMPYCYTLKHFPRTKLLLYRDFPDVFSPEYSRLCKEFANQLPPFGEDEFFMGYFITNEPEWMFQRDVNLAERTFAMDTPSASREKLLQVLQEKYGTVEALNAAWGSQFASFAELSGKAGLDQLSEQAKADFKALRDLLMDHYSLVATEAIRAVAPNAMNLGMRYSSVERGDFAGYDRFDVFSFNCYRQSPTEMLHTARDSMECPFVIGEWHYGAAENGLFSGALVNATTQTERGKACAEYMRIAFMNGSCVGAHWFELNDQPLSGRFDGENMNVGLINVCNVPYDDCVKEFAAMNNRMYPILSGKETPDPIQWAYQYRF